MSLLPWLCRKFDLVPSNFPKRVNLRICAHRRAHLSQLGTLSLWSIYTVCSPDGTRPTRIPLLGPGVVIRTRPGPPQPWTMGLIGPRSPEERACSTGHGTRISIESFASAAHLGVSERGRALNDPDVIAGASTFIADHVPKIQYLAAAPGPRLA